LRAWTRAGRPTLERCWNDFDFFHVYVKKTDTCGENGDFAGKVLAIEEERLTRLEKLEQIKPVLLEGGRTLAQAALAWLWARSSQTIPIPGFKTLAQVEENAAAMRSGPLSLQQMGRIGEILAGS
jgi:aryl-alcohol dehydrogenase-like predicted oxidoreductase